MEILDLTYKLFDKKIKSKAPGQFQFMSQDFQEHSHYYKKKKKNNKMKITKNYLILLPPLPSQDGGGRVFTFFFIDTWLLDKG